MENLSPGLEHSQPEQDENEIWRRDQVMQCDAEIEKLHVWLSTHTTPGGLSEPSFNGYNLLSATHEISYAVHSYREYQQGKSVSLRERLASLGWETWVVTNASHRGTGYRSIYLRQMAKLGGTILRSMTFRQLLEWDEERKKEKKEREDRKVIPSPWNDAVCGGCGAKKRTWADMTQWTCARCGTPLGHFPNP